MPDEGVMTPLARFGRGEREGTMVLLSVLWLACGFYAWGTFRAEVNYQNATRFAVLKETERDDVGFILFLCLFGPVSAFLAGLISNFNQRGWRLWKGYRGAPPPPPGA